MRTSVLRTWSLVVVGMAVPLSQAEAQAFPPGSAGGDCRPDNSCDPGLSCDGGMCIVTLPGNDEPSPSPPAAPPSEGPPSSPPAAAEAPPPPAEAPPATPPEPAAEAPKPTGTEGGPCYGNQTCNSGLLCTDDTCVPAVRPQGEEGGPCYGNQTCNAGLTCHQGRCLKASGGAERSAGSGRGDDRRDDEQNRPTYDDDPYDSPPRREVVVTAEGPRPEDLRGSGVGALVGRCLSLPLTGAGCGLCGFGCAGMIGGFTFIGASTVGPSADQAILGGAIALGAGLVFAVLGSGIGLAGAGARGYALYNHASAMSEGVDLDAIWATVVAVLDAFVTVFEVVGILGAWAAGMAFLALVGGGIGASFSDVDPFYRDVFVGLSQIGVPFLLIAGAALPAALALAVLGLILDVALLAGSYAVEGPGGYAALPELHPTVRQARWWGGGGRGGRRAGGMAF